MTVSAALLVKDPPIDRLAALVEYLRPVVSEFVIVVDDRTAVETADIMSTWPNVTLVPFGWVDDFSIARNAALPHLTGDWVLHVDPDELPSAAMFDFLRNLNESPMPEDVQWQGGTYYAPRGFLFFTRNFFGGIHGEEWEEHWHCRLFRNGHGFWYKPVHEQVALDGRIEDETRNTPLLPKVWGAPLIHSKGADRIGVDDIVYNRIEAPDLAKRDFVAR